MNTRHIVWDWNGTLLDDLPIVIEAVNRSIGVFGEGPIVGDDYRDHYTRPVRSFYVSLFGRELSDDEWLLLNTGFHDAYFELAATVDLAPDAVEAMNWVADRGWTQSLLSMSPQEWLESIVARLELTERFVRVDGLTEVTGGLKDVHLEAHLAAMGVEGASVVVVGDTPDDVAAARHVGGTPILYHGGSHHMELLEAEGVPIAESLVEAVEIGFAT